MSADAKTTMYQTFLPLSECLTVIQTQPLPSASLVVKLPDLTEASESQEQRPEAPKRVRAPRIKKTTPTLVETDQSTETCSFCKKFDGNEAALIRHLCVQKRRHFEREEKHVIIGFRAYTRFYAIRMMPRGAPPSYDSFAKSSLYGDFTKFGRHILNINAINPTAFIEFLIKAEIKIADWCKMAVYQTYVRDISRNELPIDAMERNVLLMQQWSLSSGFQWSDFFKEVSSSQATLWITSGRISPWLLFTAKSAALLFERLSPEQLAMIEKAIDPDFWSLKLQHHVEATEHIRAVMREAGL